MFILGFILGLAVGGGVMAFVYYKNKTKMDALVEDLLAKANSKE
jgi:hypothetical protein